MCVVVGAGIRGFLNEGGAAWACRFREALRTRVREEDRGGTLPGAMLYILETLLLSAGLGGDGVLEDLPRYIDLPPLLSVLVFLPGSRFSPCHVSVLGRRLDAADAFCVTSGRDVLRGRLLSECNRRGTVSARLGSVSSRMSDKGRTFAHAGACREGALGSLEELPTIPPLLATRLLFKSGDVAEDELLPRSREGRVPENGPAPGWYCEWFDPFNSRPASSASVIAACPTAALRRALRSHVADPRTIAGRLIRCGYMWIE